MLLDPKIHESGKSLPRHGLVLVSPVFDIDPAMQAHERGHQYGIQAPLKSKSGEDEDPQQEEPLLLEIVPNTSRKYCAHEKNLKAGDEQDPYEKET